MATVTIANTTANISGKTAIFAERDYTVTGSWTFSRSPSAPFVVTAASAKVANLDADKLDGLDSTAFAVLGSAQTFTAAQQFPAGSNAAASVAINDTDVGLYSSGTNALDFTTNGVKALGIDSTQFIDSPTQPRCQVFHATTQSLTSGATTALLFNSEDHDTGAMHDTGSNTSRLTVPTGGDGAYLLLGTAQLTNAVNSFHIWWRKNGATDISTRTVGTQVAGGSPQGLTNPALVVLAAGDYVELMALQDSGGAVNSGSATRTNSNQAIAVKLW